jgi:hypothetical protein
MSYIGNPTLQVAFVTDQFSGTGAQTTYTMSVAPANTASVLVSIHGVVQDPTTYAVLGTTLTFSQAPPAGTGNISCRYLGIPASGVNTTAYRTVTDFTATSGQTTFSVPSYTVGYIDVYRNGVKLGLADFTATSGTTVVLANACTAGDLVETVSFYVSSVLNAIPAAAGGVVDSYITNMSASKLTGSRNIPASTMPPGSIIQIVSVTKVDTFSSTGTTYTDVTGLAASITPLFATSKLMISIAGHGAASGIAGLRVTDASGGIIAPYGTPYQSNYYSSHVQIAYNAGDGNQFTAFGCQFIESSAVGTTASVTRKTQIRGEASGTVVAINRGTSPSNSGYDSPTTTITIMEIAQ